MTRIVYVDCFSGASGDMLLGGLIDAGLSLDELRADIAQLHLEQVELVAKPHQSHGLTGTHFDVLDAADQHPVRNLGAVREIIGNSDLPQDVQEQALTVFERLARAEAKVHGTTIDQVHFHEIGAVDSLVDIVGFCCGIKRLGVEQVYASPIPLGSGTITTAHGLIPVPVPATIALLAEKEVPTVPSPATTEIVTPTGAALLSTLAIFKRPAMSISKVGYGFGTKELPWANMLRVWLGDSSEARGHAHNHNHDAHGHSHGHGEHEHDHDAHGHSHDHGEHQHDHEHTQDHGEHQHEHDHEHDHKHAHAHDHESHDAAHA